MASYYVQETIEKSRRRTLLFKRIYSSSTGVSILVAAVLFVNFLITLYRTGRMESMFLPCLIGVFVVGVPMAVARKKYVDELKEFDSIYKRYVVREVLDEQLDCVEYIGSQGFTKQQIQEFQLVSLANYVGSEDYLKASYGDVVFESSDVLIKYTHPKEKDIVYFRGRMLKLPYMGQPGVEVKIFSKNFKFRMDGNAVLVDFFGITQSMMGGDTSTQIQTGDAGFRKKFDVYCASEQGVAQIVTPMLIEQIKQLGSKYDSIAFRFTENALYVAIDSGENTFKCSPDVPIEYEWEEGKICSEIDEIKMLIDSLCLR